MPTIATSLKLGSIDPLDRELLLAWALKRDRIFVLAHPEHQISERQLQRFRKIIARREQGEPLAYILGEKEFFDLLFHVNRSTLIPRPETELLVESALNHIKNKISKVKNERIVVIDVGTGSGCIIISLVKSLQVPYSILHTPYSFLAADISKRALSMAEKNAKRHGVKEEIAFIQSDLLKNIELQLKPFDELLVLANLPYLSEQLYKNTDSTVHNFEPKTALVSGQDGLDHYRRLLVQLSTLAKTKKVTFWLEISPEQAAHIPALLSEQGVTHFQALPDLTGRARLVTGSM